MIILNLYYFNSKWGKYAQAKAKMIKCRNLTKMATLIIITIKTNSNSKKASMKCPST